MSEIVGMVDRQTEGIAHSTSMIQTSVDRVKAGLTEGAGVEAALQPNGARGGTTGGHYRCGAG